MACYLLNHAVHGALPLALRWCKPAGSTMHMSARKAPLDFYFSTDVAGAAPIKDANAENKGTKYGTPLCKDTALNHSLKCHASISGTPKQIAHAASTKHRGNQPTFVHMHGVHYTFIFAMRSRYLCKDKLPKKFAGGGNSDTINIETSAIATIPFVDKEHGAASHGRKTTLCLEPKNGSTSCPICSALQRQPRTQWHLGARPIVSTN